VEYEKSLKEIEANYLSLLDTLKKHSRHCEKYPHEATHVINCENSTGDYLFNCRNTISSFNCRDLEDCGYCMQMPPRSNNAYDMLYCWGELLYNSISAVNGNKNVCCIFCWDSPDSDYSFECFYSQNLLGCVGLKHSEYKILNKKYSPEEHEKLRTKIIDKMKENGSYGEFFPMQYSPFCYNETIAHDYFPMKKDEVIGKGLQWQENFTYTVGKETKKKIPTEISDDLTKEIFACEKCRRNYKFVKQELDIYKKSGLPLPIFCPECRNTARAQRRPPQKLWARNCAKCGNPMQTSFSPNRPEIVYCKDCYLKEIY
jgi:CxxC-x17-CxxC domain-containing protein